MHAAFNLSMTLLYPPRESMVSDITAGDGNIEMLFLRYMLKDWIRPRSVLVKGQCREIVLYYLFKVNF
jgi:hypothetical protein